uniref:Pyrin n=1 Tax=Moschus moschiferus TaxID=68415 RepID=A0A8C6DHE1_MOSMO
MARTRSDHLLYSLEELLPYDFEKFKFKLQNTSLEKEHTRIPRGQLQTAEPVKLASLLVNHYGEEYAVQLTLQVLRAINQHLLAEELHQVISPEGTCVQTSSSGEMKPKSLKTPDGLEGDDKQRQSADGAGCPSSSQPEAGRGPQKKPLGKQRDQKGSEGLEVQGKLGARNTTLSPKRSPFLAKVPREEKGSYPSVRLRRNASSAGRLQGLTSGSFAGSPGRRETKISEVCLPSGKKRPKSLELTISPEETGPLNPETLLLQEKMNTENPGSATTASEVATLKSGPTATLEKDSRNPEHATTMEGTALRNTPLSVLPAGKTMIGEHLEPTAPAERSGTGAPKASSVPHEPSDPEVSPSSGKKGPQSPEDLISLEMMTGAGRLQDKAECPLCSAQEGDPVGGNCVHISCSCSAASRDPEASISRSSSCPRCQDLLPGKSHGNRDLPQCKRHMKQVQLLFCEDHGELICLICQLSQEHRGHRVRPIEEAALEYKEQIQKQLEHLKELRKSGEEQRSQGDKKPVNSLKQAETQKQRIQYQLEQLCQFLEQQEQLFVAWLEELGQTIGQVREMYGTRGTRDITLLDELIGELEAKQCQPEWELMKDIGVTLHRAKMVTVPELWATPPEVKEKIHLLYQKSEFVEKRMKHFLGRWACGRMGSAPSPALKSCVAQTPWHVFSISLGGCSPSDWGCSALPLFPFSL